MVQFCCFLRHRVLFFTYVCNLFYGLPFISYVGAVRELSRFIAAGRLHCKIDKVGGIVETTRPDSKNWQYQASC